MNPPLTALQTKMASYKANAMNHALLSYVHIPCPPVHGTRCPLRDVLRLEWSGLSPQHPHRQYSGAERKWFFASVRGLCERPAEASESFWLTVMHDGCFWLHNCKSIIISLSWTTTLPIRFWDKISFAYSMRGGAFIRFPTRLKFMLVVWTHLKSPLGKISVDSSGVSINLFSPSMHLRIFCCFSLRIGNLWPAPLLLHPTSSFFTVSNTSALASPCEIPDERAFCSTSRTTTAAILPSQTNNLQTTWYALRSPWG